MNGLTLRTKAAIVFVLLAAIPALATGALLVFVNADAVKTSERQLQTATLSELAAFIDSYVGNAEDDVVALRDALELEAVGSGDGVPTSIRSVLKSVRHLASARLQVPAASTDVTLFRHPELQEEPPALDEAAIAEMQHDVTLTRAEDGRLVMAARVEPSEGNAGYLTATLILKPIEERLERVAATRFAGSGARVLLGDAQRWHIASHGLTEEEMTASANNAVWQLVPARSNSQFAIVSAIEVEAEPYLAGIETLPRLGWFLATWRPESEAYASSALMVQRTGLSAVVATLLALGLGLYAASRLTRPIRAMAAQAKRIGERRWDVLEPLPESGDELGQLSTSLNDMAQTLQQGENRIAEEARLRHELSRYMSRPAVEQIIAGKLPLHAPGKRGEATVLFASFVSFTTLAEEGKPEDVVNLLNELYALLTEIVFRHDGVVDKFIGEGIMASWGAPESNPNHASKALDAADDMLRFVNVANEDWEDRFGIRVSMAFGLNTGDCIAGNVGSDKRLEYTVIGDTVNIAARLEEVASANQILLTESTKNAADEDFETTFIGEHRLMGRRGYSRVYALEVAE